MIDQINSLKNNIEILKKQYEEECSELWFNKFYPRKQNIEQQICDLQEQCNHKLEIHSTMATWQECKLCGLVTQIWR